MNAAGSADHPGRDTIKIGTGLFEARPVFQPSRRPRSG
jgi:hypothetical protein